MEIEGLIEQFLSEDVPPELLSTPLPDEVAATVVEGLIKEFERYWYTNMNCSLKYAERIIAIGHARNDRSQIASGIMRRADCIADLGSLEEAWDLYEQAGLMFQMAGDEVGWGRTRVGRLYLGPKLNRISTTLAEAEQARAIFIRYGERDRLLRLDWQTALMYKSVGEQHRALELFLGTLTMAESLGQAGRPHIGPLYASIGDTYHALGDLYEALMYYNRALELAIAHDETLIIASLEASMAEIAQAQGQYLRALTLLHRALEKVQVESPFKATAIKLHMVECCLALNRYTEAHELARQLISDFRTFNAADELALALLLLAMAEAALGNLDSAQTALEEAEPIFTSLNATTWVATIRLWRGRMALRRGDAESAYRESVAAATAFEVDGQQVNDATATLLQGQVLFSLNKFDSAAKAGHKALGIAQRYNVPSLRYAAHLLLGRIDEARHADGRAVRYYKAAASTIERVQRGLTITLRSGFLEDKGEAMRALIALHLRSGDIRNAFETLERAKSQTWLGYLINREQLRWAQEDPRSLPLIEELDQLRAEHQWFYRLAHNPPKDTEIPNAVQPEHALVEVAVRERRMRAITDQLYLHSGGGLWDNQAPVPALEEIQKGLEEGTLLVEYYRNNEELWAFTLDSRNLRAHPLPLAIDRLNELMRLARNNFSSALMVDPNSLPASILTQQAQKIMRRLYEMLIEPLEIERNNPDKLIIVPYGTLHALPFQLLYDGSSFLIERYEIVNLPAAGLVTRQGPKRPPGALALAHSWDGRLPQTHAEAQAVHQFLGGRLSIDEAVQRSVLQTAPTQVLHIAAHGEYRLDQPDLSYLQFADGQLYTDDVLQQDLSYELVTLSGCETGLANVAANEELIGLGRGFLYAGAGALILSLWSVADGSTPHLMKHLYRALSKGESKSAALREAQRSILVENRKLHPAYWGAFQLIGDAKPLSS